MPIRPINRPVARSHASHWQYPSSFHARRKRATCSRGSTSSSRHCRRSSRAVVTSLGTIAAYARRVASLSTPLIVLVFVAGSVATWIAGISLSKSTDSLDRRFGLGEELGGLILLAIAGTLPEIAIVASAAVAGHLDIAVGNLIGGVAMQTLVLVVLDATSGPKRPLSYLVGSLTPVLEALIVVVCLATVLAGAALPASTSVGGVSPTSIAVV